MNIGNKIKELRKKRSITQEQLGESIGVSFQAVSKWENGTALPDISLIPILAGFFCVTTDELLGFSLTEIEEEVEKITDEAYRYRESNPQKSKKILEDGLKKYPENDILLNNLLYVINYTENPDETIAAAAKIIENTKRSDVKYDAFRFLAYAYKAKGDTSRAEEAIEQIPEIYFTKLSEKAYILSGKAKFEAAEKQKWISFENLLQMIWKCAEYYDECAEYKEAIGETENALKLLETTENLSFDVYREFFAKQLKRLKKKLADK